LELVVGFAVFVDSFYHVNPILLVRPILFYMRIYFLAVFEGWHSNTTDATPVLTPPDF
jgi:hypothetical protein